MAGATSGGTIAKRGGSFGGGSAESIPALNTAGGGQSEQARLAGSFGFGGGSAPSVGTLTPPPAPAGAGSFGGGSAPSVGAFSTPYAQYGQNEVRKSADQPLGGTTNKSGPVNAGASK